MKNWILFVILTLFPFITSAGQAGGQFEKWNWLIGSWDGEGSGKPGSGSGTFSFSPDLNNNIVVRKSHSEYPATSSSPALVHEDLMIIYHSADGISDKAIYFDNEKHVINYYVTFEDNSIFLTGEKVEGLPVFRLIYTKLDENRVNTRFEMSQDGKSFSPYIEGISRRKTVSP